MLADDAIVKPIKGRNAPDLGELAVMVGSERDLFDICDLMHAERNDFHRMFNSRLYRVDSGNASVSLSGPVIGAPYAAMLVETLIAWGAKKILYFGWCGAISPDIRIGDVIVPTRAVIDDGTSIHYRNSADSLVSPSESMAKDVGDRLAAEALSFHRGTIWTTDAIYRETPEKVLKHQRDGVLAVEMECAALFTVAQFRRIDAGAVLVVSDELSTLKWRPGFSEKKFKQARRAVGGVIHALCQSP